MPQLTFYIDDTLDYVDNMEVLFKEIKSADISTATALPISPEEAPSISPAREGNLEDEEGDKSSKA